MSKRAIAILATALLYGAPGAHARAESPELGFLSTDGRKFVDPTGREVLLHGVNIGAKHKRTNYVSYHGPEDFAQMRRYGFNCVRLLIIWAAIEPECGVYNEEFLQRIDQRIAWAKANGLYVLLDMHQDLWGEKPGGDGAPAWATLDQGRPHHKLGIVWSDAYFVSPMVQTAFDSFWANKPGPDGVGIQDRFALAWQHVAKRYADEPAVVGYDLFNEPFAGSAILLAEAKLVPRLLELLRPNEPSDGLGGLVTLLRDAPDRKEIYALFNDVEVYRDTIDIVGPVFQHFERTKLAPMYQRVADAIRKVDKRHILFLEPSVMCNVGIRSALPPVKGPDGERDPLQALAPHAYDIVTEVKGAGDVNDARARLIFDRHREHADRLDVPILIGEWGAFNAEDEELSGAKAYVRNLERILASETYWYFHRHVPNTRYFGLIRRPVPTRLAGELIRYRLDPDSGVFECVWREDPTVKAPTTIYVPAGWYPDGFEAALRPEGDGHRFEGITSDGLDGHLVIRPLGKRAERRLTLRPM